MNEAYIALGSNITPRENFLKDAIILLKEHKEINIEQKSAVYETAPVGYTEQNDFLNMVIRINTGLSPSELLQYCQEIERVLGRKRLVKWGPRTIDLDILLYNNENMNAEHLTIPHPHMHERAFVMVPLADLDPKTYLPHLKQTAGEALGLLPSEEVDSMSEWGRI
ncbi:2-amino-4-hydroxy-6-hydroxymethyldihydropteridine diphosphokinase [Halobacillus karajensis]|uniref:2-amino-4-hydroxy-6-hydroxymethyldihydropteridine diphosphokinase n=1 Tax=Halobacillus karajensis TaxID=195088 RepID=A0A024P9N8_9BACI|nr:2-amino-4-hydroxy-6-hydroxymethyldihydropteridine diphosphokinase [Halobacillus karajensis]CDQ21803.1 2-amino-4-hydroxy-6-hydroxymethyldihydropteridinepyrophosphokinase [Halobacillus karajensis]CDQ25799.1 2-amino-4-hydroxy-6-hydroxymethyldihydropteridinepyrophosphokinase [Halobacillus karajensis]CDQ29800.1 2-amino-4-hydroxy-6-hydroxymethyldihydropteridinepyrophosphokinase [Halobacillus karajensis]